MHAFQMHGGMAYESNCSSIESSLFLAKNATSYCDMCVSMVESIQDTLNFRKSVPPSSNYCYEDVVSEEPVTSTATHSRNHFKIVCFCLTTTVIVIGALLVYCLSLLLLLAGDVELNPGPGLGMYFLML